MSVGIMIVSPSIAEWVVGVGIGGVGDNFIVGKSVTESSVGIRISLTIEVRVLCLSIRFSFSHETPLSNWGLNFRLSPIINSIRVEGLVVSGVGNWAFQRLQSLSEGHSIFHVHIDIIVVGVGVSGISRRIVRREISVIKT